MLVKNKWKIIFLTVSVLCLAVLAGGTIYYAWKGEKIAKNSNKFSTSEKFSPTSKGLFSVNIIKIKKTTDPNQVEWKSESRKENISSCNAWMTTDKKYVLEMFQEEGFCDPNFKSFWENWEQELKDNYWLVKEKRQESNRVVYSKWYENDQGEKIKELGSSERW